MNSYVSVEEEEVECDDLDSLVLSASGIFGTNFSTKGSNSDFATNKEDLHSPVVSSTTDDLISVSGDCLSSNKRETRSKSKLKSFQDFKEINFSQNFKVNPEFEIDGKLISLDGAETYENINSLDIECLPFETVLMNYPGQVDYFDLNDKILNISGSPNPFDSDQESESFDGFSDNSNSSFEGFNDCDTSSQINHFGKQDTSKAKSPKFYLTSKKQASDSNFKSKINPESIHKGILSPVFGDHRVTPLTLNTKDFVSKLDLNFDSSSKTGHSQPRQLSDKDIKLPESSQNYFKSATSPFCYSATSKFKEKTNESRTMQQKSKKERLTSSYKDNIHKRYEFSMENEAEKIEHYEDIFSDDSDIDITFEGFTENLENLAIDIKNEPEDSNDTEEEYIGINCSKSSCTISWLESKQAKHPPQLVNNGIVFELSEFAKKIAWEPDYVAEWICRLKGYLDIKVSDEDMRKINYVLKRRKALTVNFAGKNMLKSKLAAFDTELFTLPTIENLQIIENANVSVKNGIDDCAGQKVNFKKLSTNKSIQRANTSIEDNVVSERKQELRCVNSNLQEEAVNSNKSDKDDSSEMADHLDMDGLFDISDLDISDKDTSDNENISKLNKDLSENLGNKYSTENRISGRVRKPTTKAQESYSIKCYGSATPPQINDSNSTMRSKILHEVFPYDGKEIGPHCKAAHIDIELLNSGNEASLPITKGVVYELYNFFRERNASLTSLVHTLYRLKNIPFDKSHIIATMAKIHEMVKVMWKENIDKDKNMPFEEINLLDFECSEKIMKEPSSPKTNIFKQNTLESIPEPLNKKRKYSCSIESKSTKETDTILEMPTESMNENSNKAIESTPEPLNKKSKYSCSIESLPTKETDTILEMPTESMKENSNKAFDLNSTKGLEGKITRGDIVYLYTKWLKKKMEGQSNVFVTDLSKDVEELITDRKVECIRIPVGTLMSSSVKLFEEFRKLSKVNMLDAKTYLLEDWIDDIKCILNSNEKKLEASQDLSVAKISSTNNSNRNKFIKVQNYPKDSIPFVKEDGLRNSKLITETKKSEGSLKLDDYEVEKIVGYRIVKMGEESVTEYRIRWLGFSSKDDSWINGADLNCPDILARFWEALNKQRALKTKTDSLTTENFNNKHLVSDSNIKHDKSNSNQNSAKVDEPMNQSLEYMAPVTYAFHNNAISEEKHSLSSKDQENISPFFGKENKNYNFFQIMINCLKLDLVDYQHEEESSFSKRIKITKGEVLRLYDDWRLENLTNSSKKVDVSVLISKVKDLVASKKVRNFNPSSLIDACYRMSLMRAKLKDDNKVQEYLSGDFIELMQMSQKHQDFVRSENADKLKKIKQGKSNGLNENDKLNTKINSINNLERESLIIAKYLDTNKNKNIEKDLEKDIFYLKKKLDKEVEENVIKNIKRENLNIIKDLEAYGVVENTLDEILNIANKIKI